MTDHLLDVHLDFDPVLLPLDRKAATRTVYEASHKAAVDAAATEGRTLRHPDPRETVIKAATHPITGQDVLLVSTRWLAD